MLRKFVCHSHKVQSIAQKYGWYTGARYTNLRDIKEFEKLWFLDINWKSYSFSKHLEVVKMIRPHVTVARDITDIRDTNMILAEAYELAKYVKYIIVVPKDRRASESMSQIRN